jgi:uncharacterized protein YigE (DUF2233 family)
MRPLSRAFAAACILALVAAGGVVHARSRRAAPVEPACVAKTFEGSGFTVCRYRRGVDVLSLAWAGPTGPLGGFEALAKSLGPGARRVRFAMNAGMYDPQQGPVGLLVLEGRTRHPAETATGTGNFYLLPNGVFSVSRDGSVRVEETHRFLFRSDSPQWATQSGPLLLQDGKIHPAIQPNGESVVVRNGVGVADGSTAWFVISDGPVSFGRFARLFRDELGCKDALYFDGHISSLWAPELHRQDPRTGLGPMLVVSRKPGR